MENDDKDIKDINIYPTTLENLTTQSNVIGKIKIQKIGIEYPILNETTEELMKIAPTKYYGPRPNRNRKFGNHRP